MRKYRIEKALKVRNSYRESLENIYNNVARFHWTHADLIRYRLDLMREDGYRRLPMWAVHELKGADDLLYKLMWKKLVFSYEVNGEMLPIGCAKYRRISPRTIHEKCAHTGAYVWVDSPDSLFTTPGSSSTHG
jgi:hypothetical protein